MGPLRLLILNWRDPMNPRAGGAETFTHEVARRLVASGDTVDWFSAGFPGAATEEELDGVRIFRKGRQWTVHWRAFRRYRGHLRGLYDAVIDEVNTIPFFTPLWAQIPYFMLIHQLAREVWWYESPLPLSAMGYLAEPLYLQCYRRAPIFTVSASTKRDLRRFGLKGRITIIPEGLQQISQPKVDKPSIPSFLYVGRMSPSKRIGDIVQAFAKFRALLGVGQLWLVGQGSVPYTRELHALVDRLGLTKHVQFCGWLPSAEKQQRMALAHMLLMTSAREGWGLVVIEGNACGTPSVVYDVPGLRDAVRHEQTGLIVRPSPSELTKGMLRLWTDKAMYLRLSFEARRWSQEFSFDTAATMLREEILCHLQAAAIDDPCLNRIDPQHGSL